jgi:hypothetical protein
MEDYSYSSNRIPLKNASVLFASSHGSVHNTLFDNIRHLVKFYVEEKKDILDPMDVETIMKDIKTFIYTKVLYSPMARTNTFALEGNETIDTYLKYGFPQYNSLKLNNITSLNLKTKFKQVRKYINVSSEKRILLLNYDKIINFFQSEFSIPKMHNVMVLDENNEHLFIKQHKPDAMFLKNKVEKNDVVNAKWLISENIKVVLQIPLIKNSHPDDKFMTWVKDQLSITPKLSAQEYCDYSKQEINNYDNLRKYYGDEVVFNEQFQPQKTIISSVRLPTALLRFLPFRSHNQPSQQSVGRRAQHRLYDRQKITKIKELRLKLCEFVRLNREDKKNDLEILIAENHNLKQGHRMYDGILNEKTPDAKYSFSDKKHVGFDGLHRFLYLKDGKKRSNNGKKLESNYLNQSYCSLLKKEGSNKDIQSYIKRMLDYGICNNIKENLNVPLSWIILSAWADKMQHLTIFEIACRKYHPNDIHLTNDAFRRKTSTTSNSIKDKNIRPIRNSLRRELGDKLKFKKYSKKKSKKQSSQPKNKINSKSSLSKTKKCPSGSSVNLKTGRCRKKCLPNQVRNDKDKCVKSRLHSIKQNSQNNITIKSKQKTKSKTESSHSKTKKCPSGSSVNPKTGRCRKNCLPNQVRNDKDNCVKSKIK